MRKHKGSAQAGSQASALGAGAALRIGGTERSETRRAIRGRWAGSRRRMADAGDREPTGRRCTVGPRAPAALRSHLWNHALTARRKIGVVRLKLIRPVEDHEGIVVLVESEQVHPNHGVVHLAVVTPHT